ncbi:Valacyclovir hydrolase [Halotydeus destructor]|nr:Valacyclovir hydrolase [Halotydeus destructor]
MVESGKVSYNGSDVHYEKSGTGSHAVLLLAPALHSPTERFKGQFSGFDLTKFTLIGLDVPGYGKSRPPERSLENYHLSDSKASVAVMKSLGHSKFSVIGAGTGGATGIVLAATHPDTVQRLVIVNSLVNLTDELRAQYAKKRDVTSLKPSVLSTLDATYGRQVASKLWTEYVDYTLKCDPSMGTVLNQVKCPVFVAHGNKHPFCPDDQVDYVRSNVKSQLTVEQFSKPAPQSGNVEQFNELVQTFLSQ